MLQPQHVTYAAHPPNAHGSTHNLIDHLLSVGDLAARFSAKFGAAELGRWAGRWHDVGKFTPSFQNYLLGEERGGGPDHKAAGALMALEHFSPLCFVINGHHGGLPSLQQLKPWLASKRYSPLVKESLREALAEGLELNPNQPLSVPSWLQSAGREEAEMFVRMLFSALVDADFIDTERHCCPEHAALRNVPRANLRELESMFHRNFERAISARRQGAREARKKVLARCLRIAEQPSGVFTLPIGPPIDRILYSLGFALRHALRHSADRVIVVVPISSLKKRMAEIYSVLASRSQLLDANETAPIMGCSDLGSFSSLKSQLASENWNAPVVVSSMAEFFESLLSNQPGRCRKLHNICRSVVVLEEPEYVPLGLLAPVTHVLNGLVSNYGVTLVLATERFSGLDKTLLRPAFETAAAILPGRFRSSIWRPRVSCEFESAPISWEQIAERMACLDQVLTITNSKTDALQVLRKLENHEGVFHLSTWLCSAHRQDVISAIRMRLRCGLPCRVIATQIVETLRFQFPVVFRAIGPLERVLLAATCCKQTRKGSSSGMLMVFEPEHNAGPRGPYSTATAITRNLLRRNKAKIDTTSVFEEYRRVLLGSVHQDKNQLQSLRGAFDFPAVAERSRFLELDTVDVIVQYTPAGRHLSPASVLLSRMRQDDSQPDLNRLLERFTVPVYRSTAKAWEAETRIVPVIPGLWQWNRSYHPIAGIGLEDNSEHNAINL